MKFSSLDATLLPTLIKLDRKEHALSFFPNGQPSPPTAKKKVPSVLPNH